MKISDFKIKFSSLDAVIRAAKMFELQKQSDANVIIGNYKFAKQCHKELAKTAVEDFETYKKLPIIHYIIPGMSIKSIFELVFNNFKYKMYCKLVKSTPEEKLFKKMNQEYYSNLSKDDIKKKTIDITIPSLFNPF